MHYLTVPNFDPVIFSLGPLAIRWYSLAYICGILFAFLLLKIFNRQDKIMSEQALENWIVWGVLGVILGGRIGYILFYNFHFYLHHPLQIFAVWRGGMSFHGGLIGAIVSMILFCRVYKIEFFKLTDILAVATPIGLFFGRIANFINLELYGRVTTSKFGVIFPNAGNLPRYPSQLFEAALEGLLLFIILFSLAKFTKIRSKSGFLSGLFLTLYAFARAFIEQFREPDENIGLLFGANITMGQILSLPVLLAGIGIIIFALKKNKSNSSS
jgi:phosphatidylglycerol:prolipoprotein diacylglycerol transferase